MRINRESLAYRSAVLAASNILLQLMGFAYRIVLSRLAGAEGMGVHALSMQVYSVLYSVCISGAAVAVTTLSARLYIKSGIHSVQRLMRFAATVFLIVLAVMTCPVLMLREGIAVTLLGDGRASMALWLIPLCIMLTGLEKRNEVSPSWNGQDPQDRGIGAVRAGNTIYACNIAVEQSVEWRL